MLQGHSLLVEEGREKEKVRAGERQRQTDRQTDRQTETDIERERVGAGKESSTELLSLQRDRGTEMETYR